MTSLEQRRRELAVAWAAWLLAAAGWLTVLLPPAAPPAPEPSGSWVCAFDCRSGPGRLLFGEPLDLNRASAEALDVLPGIGPARARAIVEERNRGPFAKVDDLRSVRGIGPRTVAGLAGWVYVAAPRFDETPPDG